MVLGVYVKSFPVPWHMNISFMTISEIRWTVTAELRQTIRQEMENNRNCKDRQRIRYLISEGLDRLKRLDEMLDMQGHWWNEYAQVCNKILSTFQNFYKKML